jgi:DNA-binding IclR family transcriptional regulator
MTDDNVSGDRQASSLQRAMQILEVCAAAADGCSYSECASATGLPAPTLARLLRSLQSLAWLSHADGRYRPTASLREMARRLGRTVSRQDILRQHFRALAEQCQESAAYYEGVDQMVMLVMKHEMPDGVHYMPTGGRVPEICWHGFAQIWLAHLSPAQRDRLIAESPFAPRDGRRQFLSQLVGMRRQGLVRETGEHSPRVGRIAAPVFAGSGDILGGVHHRSWPFHR